jgi:hypothetical protein
MGSSFCCDSNPNHLQTENFSEVSIVSIEPSSLSIDKTFAHIPFSNIYTEVAEKTSERFSDKH